MNELDVEFRVLDSRLEGLENTGMVYASDGAAGLDLRATIVQPVVLAPGATLLFGTGIAVNIKNENYAAILLPRSGLGHKHGVVLGNLVGLIDSDYQGEVKVSLWNRGDRAYEVQPLERIAQMVIIPVVRAAFRRVSDFAPTERGGNGFGSSGKL